MVIQVYTREKQRAIAQILKDFEGMSVKYYSSKLFVGDYVALENPLLVVDRKQNLLEICNNVCQDHKRFTNELKRANEYGIKVVILCEHSKNIRTLNDVQKWINPRLKTSKLAVSVERLYKILSTMSAHYDVDFVFCDKPHTGQKIVEILGGERSG